jgi:hypothetical protein
MVNLVVRIILAQRLLSRGCSDASLDYFLQNDPFHAIDQSVN